MRLSSMNQPPGRAVYAIILLILASLPLAALAALRFRAVGLDLGTTPFSVIGFGAVPLAALTLLVVAGGLYRRATWAWYGAVAALVGITLAAIAAIGGGIFTILTAPDDWLSILAQGFGLAFVIIGVGFILPARRSFASLRANPPAGTFRSAPQAAIVVGLLVAAILWTRLLGPMFAAATPR